LNNSNNCFIAIGTIVKPYGINGQLKVFLYNNKSDVLTSDLEIWFSINGKFTQFVIESTKMHSKYRLLKLKNYESREDIDLFIKSKIIYILRSNFPKLAENKFYLVDLIGCIIKDKNNLKLGKVIDVISLPTNDSMLINDNNKNEFFIPIMNDFIKLFDLDNNVVIIEDAAKGFLN